jgi:hypothetical protein
MVQNSGTIVDPELLEDSILETLDILVWSVPDQRLEPLHIFQNLGGLRELAVRMKWGYEKTLSLGRDIHKQIRGFNPTCSSALRQRGIYQ